MYVGIMEMDSMYGRTLNRVTFMFERVRHYSLKKKISFPSWLNLAHRVPTLPPHDSTIIETKNSNKFKLFMSAKAFTLLAVLIKS